MRVGQNLNCESASDWGPVFPVLIITLVKDVSKCYCISDMSVNTLMCYVRYCGDDISLPVHCVTFSICKNANSVTKLLIR
jgi:hypothetical protein